MSERDLSGFIAELTAWAAARPHQTRIRRYGPDPEQFAELTLPATPGPHRVAVLLHGGFWRARFDRTTLLALAADLAERGWASWNIEYRRIGNGGGVPETLHDIAAALDALALEHAVLIGHSAGGQLALCQARRPDVAGVISLAGVCDLVAAAAEAIGENAAVEFTGGTPATHPEAYALADPIAQLPTATPVLLVHGDADDRVPVELSRRYAIAAAIAGDECHLVELPGTDHYALIDPRSATWRTIARYLDTLS